MVSHNYTSRGFGCIVMKYRVLAVSRVKITQVCTGPNGYK